MACGSRPPPPASAIPGAPTCCWRCSTPARRWPACSRARNVPPPRSTGAAPGSRAAPPAPSWSIPAMPMPSPASPGGRRRKLTAEIAAMAAGCKPADVFLASTGVIGEPLDATKFDAVMDRLIAERRAGAWHAGRQGHHDHRHLSEGRGRDGAARRHRGHHLRHRQGRRHDRARHGDHAVLRLHRRADRAEGLADACSSRASSTPSTR